MTLDLQLAQTRVIFKNRTWVVPVAVRFMDRRSGSCAVELLIQALSDSDALTCEFAAERLGNLGAEAWDCQCLRNGKNQGRLGEACYWYRTGKSSKVDSSAIPTWDAASAHIYERPNVERAACVIAR